MTEPFFEHLEHEAGHALHGVAVHFGHHRYHDRNTPASVPEEHTMSLVETIEAGFGKGVSDGMDKVAEVYNHFKDLAENELPKLIAEARKVQSSKIVQTLESVVLTPAEEAMVSKIIEGLPSLRVTEAAPADPAAPAPQPS